MRTIIAILAIITAGASMAQAYRWVDENGVVHYSDRPTEGAERIILPDTKPPSRPAPAYRREAPEETETEALQTSFSYQSIEVVAPAPEETLWNIEGALNVALSIQPALRPTDQVLVYVDGRAQEVRGTSFQIQEVYRGVHKIQVEILDAQGNLMGRSLPNQLYVQQTTIVGAN
jgi:hypothetical protein